MSDDAIQRYENELAEDPQSRAFAPLAEAYRKAGRLDEAIAVARAGLEVHPGYSGGLVVLGRSLYEKGELDNAAEILQKAVSETPESYLGQKFLGKVLMKKGESKGALRALEAANLLSPEDDEVVRLLDEVRSKATAPEAMKYEAGDAESDQDAQIVTYEQKPTTVDGIELPPLPINSADDTFSFSGGGTVDPAAANPTQAAEFVPEDLGVAGIPGGEMDGDDMTATVIEEEEVEQTMEIGSLDELGPEVAAFMQEGEDVIMESADDLAGDISGADMEAEEEFVIEPQDIPVPEAAAPAPISAGGEREGSHTVGVTGEPPIRNEAVHESASSYESDFSVEPAPSPADDIPELPVQVSAPDTIFVPEPMPFSPEASTASKGAVPEVAVDRKAAGDGDVNRPEPGLVSPPAPAPEAVVPFVSPVDEVSAAVPVASAVPRGAVTDVVTGQPEDRPEPASQPAAATEPVPASVPPASPPAGSVKDEQFSTETLADLYAQQGLVEKAVNIYRQILVQSPDNEAVRLKLDSLQAQQPSDGSAPPRAHPAEDARVDTPASDKKKDTLSILEGLLENVERIKRP